MARFLSIILGAVTLSGQVPSVAASMQLPVHQPTEDLRISAEAENLTRIIAVAVDPEGRIIVGQPDDGRLLVYNRNGKRIASLGGTGDGPGEFRSIPLYRGWVHGQFWQDDFLTRRVTYYVMPDSLVRSNAVKITGMVGSGVHLIIPAVIAVLSNGSMLAWSPIARTGTPAKWASELPPSAGSAVVHLSPDGQVDGLVAAWPGLGGGCEQVVNGRTHPTPECKTWAWAISPSGRRLVQVQLHEQDGKQSVVVTTLQSAGAKVFSVILPVKSYPMSASQRDSIRRSHIDQARDPDTKRKWRELRLPKFFVSLGSVVAADDGTIWVQLRNGKHGFLWHELAPDGRSERLWRLPDNVRLDVVTEDHLYGIETDDIGFDNVVRYVR